jgi:hypothetical protein
LKSRQQVEKVTIVQQKEKRLILLGHLNVPNHELKLNAQPFKSEGVYFWKIPLFGTHKFSPQVSRNAGPGKTTGITFALFYAYAAGSKQTNKKNKSLIRFFDCFIRFPVFDT